MIYLCSGPEARRENAARSNLPEICDHTTARRQWGGRVGLGTRLLNPPLIAFDGFSDGKIRAYCAYIAPIPRARFSICSLSPLIFHRDAVFFLLAPWARDCMRRRRTRLCPAGVSDSFARRATGRAL